MHVNKAAGLGSEWRMGDSTERFRSILQASDGLYAQMASQPFSRDPQVDPDLLHKVKKVSDKFSETVNIIANEPSLAFFRIQEHVRKTLPQLVDQKHEVEDIQAKVQGACFDTEYATNAVKAMQSSAIHFQNIQDLLKNAMYIKQQIVYEDTRRKQGIASPAKVGALDDDLTSLGKEAMTDSGQSTDSNEAPGMKTLPAEVPEENKEVEQFMSKNLQCDMTG